MRVAAIREIRADPGAGVADLTGMEAAARQFVLFDFDGVIVDSYAPSFSYARRYNPWLTDAGHRRLFEGNIHDTMAGFIFGPDEEFWSHYREHIFKTPPIPGIIPAVRDLSNRYGLLVISSGRSEPIREYLRRQDISDAFTDVMGGDVHRSKVEKIKMARQKYGAVALDCLFITDTLGDLREAAEAGIPALGVTWGFHPAETLARGNPKALVSDPGSLVRAIDGYFVHGTAL